ncbi:Maf family nucleotide pyrophosphatase [Desulfovibrio sp.]|uniref:Maf family nucleotide pyrophosphatase n=1 Tax=Desulfovibrio sp. TaxID=885 RepID=UPI0025BE8800|nr:Maf family nucleotide pyrophosphatase [Desulfovibrio sp.]
MAENRTPRSALFSLAPGYRLVLASASPRRRQFLTEWGLSFELTSPAGAEPSPRPGESPDAYTRRAALAKAHAAAGLLAGQGQSLLHEKNIILAADTVVAVDSDILGKPRDRQDALNMLTRLSGRGHEVISAVCLLLPGTRQAAADATQTGTTGSATSETEELVFSDASRVFFHPWPESVLRAYVATDEPCDKAGAYAIQGQGAFLVDRVEGSWSTVVGLPVTQLAALLLHRGLMLPGGGPEAE